MRIARALALLAVLAYTAPAAATGLCFHDDHGGTSWYMFPRPKLPKRQLDVATLAGTRLDHVGVSGTAYIDSQSHLRFSLFTEDQCFLSVDLGTSLTGTASYACLGGTSFTSNWTLLDCSSL